VSSRIMKRLLVAMLTCILAVPAFCYAQTPKPETPKSDATTAQAQSCVIVKRHVHKFGENMSRFHPHRPFDYVEGDYPSGFKWHSELSDGDVRELQKKGGKIVIMRPDYQVSDLQDARKQCQSQVGQSER
jgi:hypothetical protein